MSELKQIIDNIEARIKEATKEQRLAKECRDGLHVDDDYGRDHFRAEMHYLQGCIDAYESAKYVCLEVMTKQSAGGGE